MAEEAFNDATGGGGGGDSIVGGDTEKIASSGILENILSEIWGSYLNMFLVGLILLLVYKIHKSRSEESARKSIPPEPTLPKLRRDFNIQELKKYDGNQPDGRVLVAVNGSVYDVTKGKRFYGPGGTYAAFGGRDASRGLATFQITSSEKEEYDDLSDLNTMEMDAVREWEMQFKEKYTLVGKLLRPGEEPSSYSDEEDEIESSKKETPAVEKPLIKDAEKTTANISATAAAAASSDDKPKSE